MASQEEINARLNKIKQNAIEKEQKKQQDLQVRYANIVNNVNNRQQNIQRPSISQRVNNRFNTIMATTTSVNDRLNELMQQRQQNRKQGSGISLNSASKINALSTPSQGLNNSRLNNGKLNLPQATLMNTKNIAKDTGLTQQQIQEAKDNQNKFSTKAIKTVSDVKNNVNEKLGVNNLIKNSANTAQQVPNIIDTAKYASTQSPALMGIRSSIAGMADAGTTELASLFEEKEEEDENILKYLPIVGNMYRGYKTGEKVINKAQEIANNGGSTGDVIWGATSKFATEHFNNIKQNIPTYAVMDKLKRGIQDTTTANLDEDTRKEIQKNIMNITNSYDEDLRKYQENQSKKSEGKQFVGRAVEGTTRMIPSIALSVISGDPSFGLSAMGVSAKGSSTKEALNNGVELNQAVKIGDMKATVEVLTELMWSGISAMGLGKKVLGDGLTDDIVQKLVLDKIKSKGLKMGATVTLDILGETAEEIIADIAGSAIDRGTYKENAKLPTIQELWQTAKDTTATTLLLNTITGGFVQNYRDINNQSNYEQMTQALSEINNNTLNEQQTTQKQDNLKEKSFEDIVDEAMSNSQYEEVKSPLQDRDIKTIGKEKVNAYQYDNPEVKPYFQEMAQMLGEDIGNIGSEDNRSTVKGGGTSLKTNISGIKQLREMGYSYNQIIDGLTNIIEDNGKENNAISKKLEIIIDDQLRNGYINSYGKYISPNEEYLNLINNDVKNQNINQQQQITQIENKNGLNRNVEGQFVDNYIKSAQQNNIDINNRAVRQIGELSSKRGVQTLFDGSYFKDNSNANAMYITDENENRSIILNPNAKVTNKTLQQIEIHELVHDMFQSEGFEKIRDMVLNYDKGKAGYAEARQALEDLYAQVYDRNADNFSALVDEEAVADILGNKLGDQQFINKLVNQKETRSKARQIYDWIVEKLNNITRSFENINEYFYWKDIKNKFENAFRQEYQGNSNSVMYSIQNYEGIGNIAQYDGINYISDDNTSISKNIKKHFDDNFKNKQIGNVKTDQGHKYAFPGRGQKNYNEVKAPAVTVLEDILNTMENPRHEDDRKVTKDGKIKKHSGLDTSGGFNHYDAKIGIPDGNGNVDIYKADAITRIDKNGREYFYDLDKIKDTGQKVVDNKSKPLTDGSVSSNNNIAQNEQNVKKINLPKTDNKGNMLSKQQQEYFKDSKVRDENGNLKVVYHGTINAGFTEFNRNFNFFTDNQDVAKTYTGNDGGVYEGYINISNPITIEANGEKWSMIDVNNISIDGIDNVKGFLDEYGASTWQEKGKLRTSTADLISAISDAIDDGKINSDGVIIKNIYDEGAYSDSSGKKLGNDYVTFKSNQFKNKNNSNPTTKSDMRYSKSEDTSNKTLLALHNLSEDKLKGILELGGFPVPSIAITNPDINNHTQFGDISVVFDKDTINPADSRNEVYDRDVWSPTFPQVNYDITNENIKKYVGDMYDFGYTRNKDSIIDQAVLRFMYQENLSQMINTEGKDRALAHIKASPEMKYLYKTQIEKGKYKPKMKNLEYNNYYSNESLQRFIDNFKEDMPLDEFYYHYLNYQDMELSKEKREDLKKQMWKAIKPDIEADFERDFKGKDLDAETRKKYLKIYFENEESALKNNPFRLNEFISNASMYAKNGAKQVIDVDATLKDISNHINQKDYEKWVDNTYGKMFENTKKGIRNDKDMYTPSGNRRSFDKLHNEYNLQNIVNYLISQDTKGGEGGFTTGGFGEIQAKRGNKFNSVEDIKNAENRITDSQETPTKLEPLRKKIQDDIYTLSNYYNTNGYSYGSFDNSANAISEFAGKKNLTEATFRKVLGTYYNFDVDKIPSKTLQKIIKDLKSLDNIPTDYFEAKPQRAVGLDEVKAIVVPNNMNQELKQQLIDRGLNVVEYDANKEGDRQAKIKALDEYKFSKTTDGKWQNRLDTIYKNKNKGTYLQDIKLPTKENLQKYSISNQDSTNLPQGKNVNQNKDINLPPSISANNQYKDSTTKVRKHYKSIIESQYTTDEARAISKELMGLDTYIPETNKNQLEKADERISNAGPESELNSLMARSTVGDKITSVDIAVGERLIQYYSKTGDATKLRDAIQATAMAGTTAGQTVQAMSLLNHQTPEGQAVWLQRSVEKMNNDLKKSRGAKAEQLHLTDEMINKIVNSESTEELYNNLDEVYKELGQQVTKTTIQKIDAWRYFSMLANPRTHIRNIGGNLAMGKVQSAKNKVAGVAEGVVSIFNKDMERTHTIVPASKEVKQFAKADIKNVTDRLGLTENKYNPKSRIESNMRTFKHKALENTIGKAFAFNDYALEAEDGWGLKAGYKKALAEYMTANKLKPGTITDAQLAKARNYAVQQAKEATFHQDCQLATLINQLSNKNKFAKYTVDAILPFKKTPMNIAKAGVEYSPVGLAKSMVYDTVQLRKGNININQYIDNISKGVTGTGIALIGYALASMGIIKASGGDDDKEKYEQNQGKQTYSIKIGDNTYSLDWLAPTAIPLFIGAEIHELTQSDNEKKTSTSSDEDTNYNRIVKSATNVLDAFTNSMNPMMEMSMLSGLTSALKSYEQGSSQMIASMGTNAVQSYVNQFFPTALGQIAKTADKYERSTTSTKSGVLPKAVDTTKNQIMAKIPGLRQMLPTKTDIWGNEMEQSDNVAIRAVENAIFPWARKKVSTNNVDEELLRLYDIDGNNAVIPDSSFSKDLTFSGQKYRMTSEEYSKYRQTYGSKSFNLLNKLIKSNEYKKLSNEEKQKAVEKVYTYVKEYCKNEYAKDNNISNEESKLYKTVQQLYKNDESEASYFSYMAKTANIEGEKANKRKMQVLADSNYTKTAKAIIYENTLGSDDSLYNDVMKSTGIDMNEYLNYKLQEFTSDKKDDGTEDGKTISGSKKAKVYNYVNNMKITGKQRMLLLGTQYKLTDSERATLANYVKDLNITKAEKLEIYKKLQGFTVYKDGRVTY